MIFFEETERKNVMRAGKYLVHRDFHFSLKQTKYFIENTCSHCKTRSICESFKSLSKYLEKEQPNLYSDANLLIAEIEGSPESLRIICRAYVLTT